MTPFARSSRPGFVRWLFRGPRELRAGWRLLVFLVIVLVLTAGSEVALRTPLAEVDVSVVLLVQELMGFAILFFASWIMGRLEGRSIATYGLPRPGIGRAQFWQGVLLGFASVTTLVIALDLAGGVQLGPLALRGAEIGKWAAVYALAFLLVGLREEFGARGYALFTLSAGIGFWPAAAVSAALFGFAHRGNPGEDWIGVFNAALIGLLACLLLRRTGNLWMPIGFHMAFDWGETYFYGVANSGTVLPGHLLNTRSSGPAWVSGGTAGPEGSVLCTLLITVIWMICAAWLREVRYPNPGPDVASRGATGARGDD